MMTSPIDLRHAVRRLLRSPAFTVVAVVCIGLGVGANTVLFSVIDALLFRPPAGVGRPDALVRLAVRMPGPPGEPPAFVNALSFPDFLDLRDKAKGFDGVAAFSRRDVTVGRGADAQRVEAVLASSNYFRVLGVTPAVGRLFTPSP